MPRVEARSLEEESSRACLHAQTFAALSPTGIEDLPAAIGGHASPEAVSPLALQIARLKGSLHDLTRSLIWYPSGADGQRGRDFMEAP